MAVLIDFQQRILAQREVDAGVPFPRSVVRGYEQPKPQRPPLQYEKRTCLFDGRTYVRALGSEDRGFCRPACTAAAARSGRGRHADA